MAIQPIWPGSMATRTVAVARLMAALLLSKSVVAFVLKLECLTIADVGDNFFFDTKMLFSFQKLILTVLKSCATVSVNGC